jgi:Flp pilus assembly protein TadB
MFEKRLLEAKRAVKECDNELDLDLVHETYKLKNWWTSILIFGLFYGINGEVGRMLLVWFLSIITLTIFGWIAIYLSYNDQSKYNQQLDKAIEKRRKEIKSGAI